MHEQGWRETVAAWLWAVEKKSLPEHYVETPERVAKVWETEFLNKPSGKDPLAQQFPAGGYNGVICVGPVRYYSLCAHHLLPVFGDVWLGYVPRDTIVGLSKLARLVQDESSGPQVQEDFTRALLDRMWSSLAPAGAAVLVKARHLCMEMRGAKSDALTTTWLTRGQLDLDTWLKIIHAHGSGVE